MSFFYLFIYFIVIANILFFKWILEPSFTDSVFRFRDSVSVSGFRIPCFSAAGTTTSRSLTWNTVAERLADRAWCTKSQSSLLNINFRLSGFQSSLLLVHFRYGLNTCSHYTKVWDRTTPIYDTPLSRSARLSFAPLQKARQTHRSYE